MSCFSEDKPRPTRRSQSASRIPAQPKIPFGGLYGGADAQEKNAAKPLGSMADGKF